MVTWINSTMLSQKWEDLLQNPSGFSFLTLSIWMVLPLEVRFALLALGTRQVFRSSQKPDSFQGCLYASLAHTEILAPNEWEELMTFVQTRPLCLIKHKYLHSKKGVRESTFHPCLTLMARIKTDKWDSKSLAYWLRTLARCMWDLDFDLCSLDYLCLVTSNGLGE